MEVLLDQQTRIVNQKHSCTHKRQSVSVVVLFKLSKVTVSNRCSDLIRRTHKVFGQAVHNPDYSHARFHEYVKAGIVLYAFD
jgi:hypothetical protein